MLQVQRPVRWLLGALGVISGVAPQELRPDVQPVMALDQDGWAFMEYLGQGIILGQIAATTTLPLVTPDPAYMRLVRISAFNPGTATVFCNIRSYDAVTGPLANNVQVGKADVPAGNNIAQSQLSGGAPFFVVPPGLGLVVQLGGFTTTAGSVTFETFRFPAGVRAF